MVAHESARGEQFEGKDVWEPGLKNIMLMLKLKFCISKEEKNEPPGFLSAITYLSDYLMLLSLLNTAANFRRVCREHWERRSTALDVGTADESWAFGIFTNRCGTSIRLATTF